MTTRPDLPTRDLPVAPPPATEPARSGDAQARTATRLGFRSTRPRLKIGIIAPPWVPIPPPAYGGTELMVDALARGLVGRGNDVQLFTVGASTCGVARHSLYEEPPERFGTAMEELRHTLAAHDRLASCDIIHDHTLAGPLLAAQGWTDVPVVTTNHGPFDDDMTDLYRRSAHRVPLVAISADQAARAPEGVTVAATIHHGLDLDGYPARLDGDRPRAGYLLSLARMHPSKGIDTAIAVARRAGRRLIIAAKMREPSEQAYYRERIWPLLDESITYVGEAGRQEKLELLAGADALLNPIAWDEPFGLTMIEALACGTPVVATPRGAASEIVRHGVNGYLASGADDLVRAVERVGAIDRRACRADAADRFSMEVMASRHEAFYHQVLAARAAGPATTDTSPATLLVPPATA